MENEIFDVKLDSKGRDLIRRMYGWAMFFYICTIVTCLVDLITTYKITQFIFSRHLIAPYRFGLILNVSFVTIYAIIVPIQAYFCFRFVNNANKALHYENSAELNDSFRWLLKHIIAAGILFAVNGIFVIATMINQLNAGLF